MIQPYYSHRFFQVVWVSSRPSKGFARDFRNGTLEAVYQHWESCTRLGTYSKVTILDYHSLEEFSATKAYANWWIRVRKPDKKILIAACMEPPLDSFWKIPSNL